MHERVELDLPSSKPSGRSCSRYGSSGLLFTVLGSKLLLAVILAVQFLEKSDDGLLSLFLIMVNYIIGPQMTCF
jgi:hypothetical protein